MSNFMGFTEPKENWSKLPHEFIGQMGKVNSLAEIKVVLYILRHTWGYHDAHGNRETEKRISLDEFCRGRKLKGGERMDGGTGMSLNAVKDGIKRAIADGFIEIAGKDETDKARVKTWYALAMLVSEVDTRVSEVDSQPSKVDTQPSTVDPRTKKDTLERYLEKDMGDSKTESPAPLKEEDCQEEPTRIVKDELPVLDHFAAETAETDEAARQWAEIEANGASDGEPPRAQSAGVATPIEDWREFKKTYLDRVAGVLGHNSPSSGDKAALKRIWQMGATGKWETFLEHIENGGGAEFQKQGANAFWIAGKFDDYRVSGTMQVDRAAQNTADALAAMRER